MNPRNPEQLLQPCTPLAGRSAAVFSGCSEVTSINSYAYEFLSSLLQIGSSTIFLPASSCPPITNYEMASGVAVAAEIRLDPGLARNGKNLRR
jgi:hypothetical protein